MTTHAALEAADVLTVDRGPGFEGIATRRGTFFVGSGTSRPELILEAEMTTKVTLRAEHGTLVVKVLEGARSAPRVSETFELAPGESREVNVWQAHWLLVTEKPE